MEEIKFNFLLTKIYKCSKNDILKNLCQKFANEQKLNFDNLCFKYDGEIFNKELTYEQICPKKDRDKHKMAISVINRGFKRSNDIICPECGEFCRIKLCDYAIKLFDCKNNHE